MPARKGNFKELDSEYLERPDWTQQIHLEGNGPIKEGSMAKVFVAVVSVSESCVEDAEGQNNLLPRLPGPQSIHAYSMCFTTS